MLSVSIFDFAPTVRDLAQVRVLVFPNRFLPQTSGSATGRARIQGWQGRLFVKVRMDKRGEDAY
jgi:hypothetical protein